MSLTTCKALLGRVHWTLWTAIGLLSVYSVLGFLAVPAALRYTITHTLTELWQRPVSVGDIRFNPFDMDLQIEQFAIANAAKTQASADTASSEQASAGSNDKAADNDAIVDVARSDIADRTAQGNEATAVTESTASVQQDAVDVEEVVLPEAGDLLRFDSLHINVHMASLLKRQLGFEIIRLENPYVRAEIDEQGQLELLHVFLKPAVNETDGAVEQSTASVEANSNNQKQVTAQSNEGASNAAIADVRDTDQLDTVASSSPDAPIEAKNTINADIASNNEVASTKQAEAKPLPPIWLSQLQIVQGKIDFIDRSKGDFAQKLVLKGIEIEDFHTARDDRSNRIALQLNDGQTGEISFRTDHFRLQPFALKGHLAIDQLALAPVWQWLNLPVNFDLTAPILSLQTNIDIAQTDQLDVKTHNGQLLLVGTQLAPKLASNKTDAINPDKAQPLIGLAQLAVSGISVNVREQQVQLAEVNASGADLTLVMDKNGNLNVLPMFAMAQTPKEEQPKEAASTAKPWSVLIQSTKLTDSKIDFTDSSPRKPFSAQIAPITIQLGEFEPLNGSKPFNVAIDLGLGAAKLTQTGKLQVDADVTLAPFSLAAKVDATDLPLPLVQPYVADALRARLTRGDLNAQLELAMDKALQVKGNASVDQLLLQHQNGRASLLSLDKLQLTSLNYNAAKNSVAIQKIALNKLASSFRINEDGSTNIQDILIEQPPSKKPAGKPLQLAINTIAINKADLGFADHTLSQNFQVAIKDLSGTIKDIKSNATQLATVDLAGKVDHYAPATIKGSFNVFGAQPKLDMGVKFDNVELTSFTPYSGTYAGFKIERGQLDIDLNYQLADNKIAGKNRIVMDQFTLGEKVESTKAIDLPLRLALALLRDEKGVIDLGFEVQGDLNDPSFSVGGILWKVLTNIVKKAVASPMKALGALSSFGGDGEANAIEFAAGSAVLTEVAKSQAAELKGALEKRAEFRLNLQGNVQPNTDRLALQRLQLAQSLAPNDTAQQQALLAGEAGDSRGQRRQLAKLYERKLNKSYDDAEATLAEQFPNAKKDELQLRTYQTVFDELAVSLAVDESALRQLAMDRALALRAYMTEELGFAANRVMVVDYNTDSSLAGNNCLIQLGM